MPLMLHKDQLHEMLTSSHFTESVVHMRNKLLIILPFIYLSGCSNVYIAADSSLKKGATIQIASMSRDPLGGVAKLTTALLKRGFIVLDGAVGKTVTNRTSTGTETYKPTIATHYLTFTYTTGQEDSGSCRLVNLATQKAEVVVDMTPLTPYAADKCADAILKAAQ